MDETKLNRLKAKVPWWSWPIRWWNRWKLDRIEKQRAIDHRKAEEERLQTPVYFGVVAGKTRYVGKPEGQNVFITHYWYLYETPEGDRSWKGEISEYADQYGCTHIKDHPWFGQIILPWVNHQIDIEQSSLLKGEIKYWNRLNAEEGEE